VVGAGRDGGVLRDDALEEAAGDGDAEGMRRDVQEQHLLLLVEQHRALDGGAESDRLVRVHALRRIPSEKALHRLLDARHSRLAADE